MKKDNARTAATHQSRVRRIAVLMPPRLRSSLKTAYLRARSVRRRLANSLPSACRTVVRGSGNTVNRSCASLKDNTISIQGHGNEVDLSRSNAVHGCTVRLEGDGNHVTFAAEGAFGVGVVIRGSNNTITIDEGCVLRGLGLVCEDDGNSISLGRWTEVAGATELAAMEGTSIAVGERCLFSSGIHARTGDSHSVVDLEGKRINPSRNVEIGNHVWVGMGVTILKGSTIPDSCVVAARSVVTRKFTSPNCVIAGNPAKVVRESIDWRVERIPTEPSI